MKMTFQEIRIIATGSCIANQLRDVNTICRRSWYIAAHVEPYVIMVFIFIVANFSKSCENDSLNVQLILGTCLWYRAAKLCYIPYAYNIVYQNKAQEAQIKMILDLNQCSPSRSILKQGERIWLLIYLSCGCSLLLSTIKYRELNCMIWKASHNIIDI